jgi:hypothetical protein
LCCLAGATLPLCPAINGFDGFREHKIIKTDPPNDMAQIKNLVDWILSL